MNVVTIRKGINNQVFKISVHRVIFKAGMTQKKHSLPMMVVLLTLAEGLAIYLNMVMHPNSQPALTIVIVILFAIASGLGIWYATRVRGILWS
jgi:hypothetical protein